MLTTRSYPQLEEIATTIPLLCIGLLGFAVATCLFVTQRLTLYARPVMQSPDMKLTSSQTRLECHWSDCICFHCRPSVTLCYFSDPCSHPDTRLSDFSQVLLHSNGRTPSDTLSGFYIAQEVFLVIALVLIFLFYLTYLGRPPYGELDTVPQNKRQKARKYSPAAWGASGYLGSFAYVLLAGAIFTVAILQVMWRLFFNPSNGVYLAGGILEVFIAVGFLVKLWLNVRSSPLTPGWKTFRNYAPVTVSIFIDLVIAILNLTMCESLVIS